MNSVKYIRYTLVLVLLIATTACKKNYVKKSKLEGHSYTVEDVAVYYEMDYETWKIQNPDGDIMEGGENVISSTGYMNFENTDESEVFFSMKYEWTDSGGYTSELDVSFTYQGMFYMYRDKADAFIIRHSPNSLGVTNEDYFQVHEVNGNEIILLFNQVSLLNDPQAILYVAKVKKD
ncbi:MAG: hypothetical protein H6599_06000 [Flavobacteriales bacterium]|nr:hypothetical protein [Flavobacteriales bacterium]